MGSVLVTNLPAVMPAKINVEVNKEDIQLVKLLSNCLTVAEIAEEMDLNKRTLEKKILIMKKAYNCKTLPGLVAFFFRNNLVK